MPPESSPTAPRRRQTPCSPHQAARTGQGLTIEDFAPPWTTAPTLPTARSFIRADSRTRPLRAAESRRSLHRTGPLRHPRRSADRAGGDPDGHRGFEHEWEAGFCLRKPKHAIPFPAFMPRTLQVFILGESLVPAVTGAGGTPHSVSAREPVRVRPLDAWQARR